ncbi:MAG: hypothetical protein GX977_02110 [Firmicutes bacterium]|nr:hypothetical protein [Bacillota bacterium]
MYVMGVDVGTTGCKAIVFDARGEALGIGFKEYDIVYPRANWAEQDPEQVWQYTQDVMAQAVAESGRRDITAISLSVQGDAVIPIDKNGRPLYSALLGMDYRSWNQAEACAQEIGGVRLFRMTGMRPHPINSLTKIMWLKENEPNIYNSTWKFTTYADFLLFRLGGVPVIDYSMASRTMAFDLSLRDWSSEILAAVDIEKAVLSRAVPSGTVLGHILPQVAAETGLSPQALLVTGGHDQTCAALGAGVIEENLALDSHGTAEVISTTFNQPVLNDLMYESYYPCYYHVVPDRFFTFALNHVGGILLQWYRDQFGSMEVSEAQAAGIGPYEQLLSEIPVGPSPVMILPHFNGSGTPVCDVRSRGAILGLTLATTRHDIVKAIMESLTYEMRVNLEIMGQAGLNIDYLRCVGGAARSPVWLQLKADMTGCHVATLQTREAACLGAALIAGTATGMYSNMSEAVETAVALDQVYSPDMRLKEQYDERYALYRELYPALREFNHGLVRIEEGRR